jgi:hypothetical protein
VKWKGKIRGDKQEFFAYLCLQQRILVALFDKLSINPSIYCVVIRKKPYDVNLRNYIYSIKTAKLIDSTIESICGYSMLSSFSNNKILRFPMHSIGNIYRLIWQSRFLEPEIRKKIGGLPLNSKSEKNKAIYWLLHLFFLSKLEGSTAYLKPRIDLLPLISQVTLHSYQCKLIFENQREVY